MGRRIILRQLEFWKHAAEARFGKVPESICFTCSKPISQSLSYAEEKFHFSASAQYKPPLGLIFLFLHLFLLTYVVT